MCGVLPDLDESHLKACLRSSTSLDYEGRLSCNLLIARDFTVIQDYIKMSLTSSNMA